MDLFNATNCGRCRDSLEGQSRKMSWFTEETICGECAAEESEIRKTLPNGGRAHEGCGYVPDKEAVNG